MALTAILLIVVAGSIVYCAITMAAARSYLASRPTPLSPPGPKPLPGPTEPRPSGSGPSAPISVLKPLSGAEDQLETNLRTFFTQTHAAYEILFAVRSPNDAAVPIVEKLQVEFPTIPTRLIVTGEPPYPNAKVFSLDHMVSAAQHELLIMSDSDIRATPEMLSTIAAEFTDPRVGLSSCPYRAVPGRGIWSKLEALGMNTQFLGGVLAARLLEGMKFALGPTIAARKPILEQMAASTSSRITWPKTSSWASSPASWATRSCYLPT